MADKQKGDLPKSVIISYLWFSPPVLAIIQLKWEYVDWLELGLWFDSNQSDNQKIFLVSWITLITHSRVTISEEISLFMLLRKFIVFGFIYFILFLQLATLIDTNTIRTPTIPDCFLDPRTCQPYKLKQFLNKFPTKLGAWTLSCTVFLREGNNHPATQTTGDLLKDTEGTLDHLLTQS